MDNKRTDVNKLGEFGLIDHITKDFEKYHESSVFGIGDDAAVIHHHPYQTLVSTDLLIEGIHFDLMYCPLKHLGYKAVIANLSDIIAMNGTPTQITVSIGLTNRFSVEAIDEVYDGIREACRVYNVDLIGGDTTSSVKGLIISITAMGFAKKEDIIYRHGAKENDLICVSGDLGGAYIGLQLMEREKSVFLAQDDTSFKPDFEGQNYLIRRHLLPEARKDIIDYFRKSDIKPTSMIDISDGLASELFHICHRSNVGANITEDHVPIHIETQQMAIKFNMDPITAALSGGEDYELLFTIDKSEVSKIQYLPDVSIIGDVVSFEDGVNLHTSAGKIHPIKAQGWNHFNNKK